MASASVVFIADRVGLEKLTAEEKRWVEKEIVKGKRNGLHLTYFIYFFGKKRPNNICKNYLIRLT